MMLCMPELAGTRSEPEAEMNAIQPEPEAGRSSMASPGVSGGAAPRHALWRVIQFKNIWANVLPPGMETLSPILMWTGIMFISWYYHIRSHCCDHDYQKELNRNPQQVVQHDLNWHPGLQVASRELAGSNRKAGNPGKERDPLEHCRHQRTACLWEWRLAHFYKALHAQNILTFVTSLYPFGKWESLRWLFPSHMVTRCQHSKTGLRNQHAWCSAKSLNGLKMWVERDDIKE